ncbi:misacylated tRNA(Ala) deacylase [Roseibium hamelinense]|uniref:Alanine--tRNA ligase n=1 Tax=Roseibium hamelinense TaxID=150831 RepID=A0A562TGR8_9HYPH|nr:alanyl-tRNA editing protein [Roseibium hamelinense]MTI46065.1 alanyl-tRNA editing protein [Roseibium hamelinense]TWI92742.1 misacylated tRNA(Ala) deacylase [Roseibium hamelinense]
MTVPLFRDDAYLRTCEAKVIGVNDRGGILLDRSVFYASAGGQPGDTGFLELDDGTHIKIETTVYDQDRNTIVHVPADTQPVPIAGMSVVVHLDWARRYRMMRMHTALHLLSVALPFPVTGGQIGDGEGRLDFDMCDAALDKDALIETVNTLAAADHEVTSEWITDAELDANPGLVKTMSVKPPRGSGQVRLVRIGGDVDLQPCGGTHVSRTSEIGPLSLGKVENKGKQNRRVRLRLDD